MYVNKKHVRSFIFMVVNLVFVMLCFIFCVSTSIYLMTSFFQMKFIKWEFGVSFQKNKERGFKCHCTQLHKLFFFFASYPPTPLHMQGFVPLFLSWESFYTRNLYRRARDCWNRPISSCAGGRIDVMERVSPDFGWNFEYVWPMLRSKPLFPKPLSYLEHHSYFQITNLRPTHFTGQIYFHCHIAFK